MPQKIQISSKVNKKTTYEVDKDSLDRHLSSGGVLIEMYKELKPEFDGQDPPKVIEAPGFQLLTKEDFEDLTRGHDDENEPDKGFFVIAGIKWIVLKGKGEDAQEGKAEDFEDPTDKQANSKTGAASKGSKNKQQKQAAAGSGTLNTTLDTLEREDEKMKQEAAAADAQAPGVLPGK